ncbi:MAG: DUF3370 family protein [Deltaproteobacteria bacterium]|nr:DUF3370 family protein [Deltaproteobacteria bacterium]
MPGVLGGERPDRTALRPLPGGGEGGPMLVSNNPELVTGRGNLYNNARPLLTRGGTPVRLSGVFGVYLHHIVDTSTAGVGGGPALFLSLLFSNPNATPVTITVRGTGLTQTETGGLGLGNSPDYRVSEDALLDTPEEVHTDVVIEPARAFLAWQRQVNDRAEVDGRFFVTSSAPVFVYVVATDTAALNEAITLTSGPPEQRLDAPGDYRISGDPPPPFGREAGVYEHDTWRSVVDLDVPTGPAHTGFVVNTATGSNFAQVQAFPALAHLDGSAREAVGMYGNFYDLTVNLRHDGRSSTPRRVRVWFTSLSTDAALSRLWDGKGLVDNIPIDVRHLPMSPSTLIGERTLSVGASSTLRFRAMVPGLTSIPQALVVETLDP